MLRLALLVQLCAVVVTGGAPTLSTPVALVAESSTTSIASSIATVTTTTATGDSTYVQLESRSQFGQRTIVGLHRYIDLFREWSVAFVSGPNLYLVRFGDPIQSPVTGEWVHRVITSNLTLRPFFNALDSSLDYPLSSASLDLPDDENRTVASSVDNGSSAAEDDEDDGPYVRLQFHRATNKLIILDSKSGRLYTFNTANLATSRLHIRTRVLDFSLNEHTNVLYYATVDESSMVKVLRVFLKHDGHDRLTVDETVVNTVLSVYVTHPDSVRLHVDYAMKSLYTFIVINARVFTYELKLFYDDTTETNTCDARCNRRFEIVRSVSKFRVSRPLLNFNFYEFVRKRGVCRIINFQSARDRLIEVEFFCPGSSSADRVIERIQAGRMANWLKDLHKSNVTFEVQSNEYAYSSIVDTSSRIPDAEHNGAIGPEYDYESWPVRVAVEHEDVDQCDHGHSRRRHHLYMERVGFMNKRDLFVYNEAPYRSTVLHNRQARRRIGTVDDGQVTSYGNWPDVGRIECMLIRQKELFRDIPEVFSFSFHRRRHATPANGKSSNRRHPAYNRTNISLPTSPLSSLPVPDLRDTVDLWHLRNNRTVRLRGSIEDRLADGTDSNPDLTIIRAQRVIIANQTNLINALYLTVFLFLIVIIVICAIITIFHFKRYLGRDSTFCQSRNTRRTCVPSALSTSSSPSSSVVAV